MVHIIIIYNTSVEIVASSQCPVSRWIYVNLLAALFRKPIGIEKLSQDEVLLHLSNRVSQNLKEEDLDLNSHDYEKEGKNQGKN